jgi:carbonic anhydrase
MAIDRIDPYRRKSQPNRLLFAMGFSNVASSLVGGLTIIPGGVKSKANIASGGRTLWANFTNAICLILYLVVARDAINLIPKGALAAVLIYTGYKMCEPLVWRHMAHIGREQLGIFTITVIATLCTDLLWGIGIGVLAKFVLNMVLYRYALAANDPTGRAPPFLQSVATFFRTPVVQHEMQGDEWHVYLARPLVCFNSMKLTAALDGTPESAKAVVIHLGPEVGLVDHTSCENLMYVVEELSRNDRPVRVVGLDAMKPLSHYENGTHIAATSLAPT